MRGKFPDENIRRAALKRKIKRRKTASKVFCVVLWVLISLVVICAVVVFCQRVIAKRKYVNFFGYSSFIVSSGSMQPDLQVNDMVTVKKVGENNISPGDIVAFFDKDGKIITHRVERIFTANGKKYYITKGDANNVSDAYPVAYENIIGKFSFSIPGGGRIVAAVTSPAGIAVIIFATASIGLLLIRRSNRRSARHSIREKYKERYAV